MNTIRYLRIKRWLDRYEVQNYTINDDHTIDVDGHVGITGYPSFDKTLKLIEFPDYIQFGTVNGDFNCSYNALTSLRGAPRIVKHNFYCSFNKLTDLVGGPEMVCGDYFCSHNKIISLKGAPKEIGGNFNCRFNRLKSVDHNCTVRGGFQY